MRLTRELRFQLPAELSPRAEPTQQRNTWAGSPACWQLAPFVVIRLTLEGTVQQPHGFYCNVSDIDPLAREALLATLIANPSHSPEQLAVRLFEQAKDCLRPTGAQLVRLQWCLTPYLSVTALQGTHDMVRVTQQFEFSAAHRLHIKELSDEENQRLFGKCNSVHGHGHNYLLDVTVSVPHAGDFSLLEFQEIVQREVIRPWDHTHLNLEVAEFKELNPTIENIAQVVWNRLQAVMPDQLQAVRVYETAKTWAEIEENTLGRSGPFAEGHGRVTR